MNLEMTKAKFTSRRGQKSNQSKRGKDYERGVSVKVSMEAYALLRALAEKNMRSISKQLQMLVQEAAK